jgi:hypothetical protein
MLLVWGTGAAATVPSCRSEVGVVYRGGIQGLHVGLVGVCTYGFVCMGLYVKVYGRFVCRVVGVVDSGL